MRLGLIVTMLVSVLSGAAQALDAKAPPGWTEASRSDDMALFYRDNEKAHAREVLAYAELDAPPEKVYKLLTDYENWTKLIPYTKEAKILARLGKNELITYQLISPPFVSDRDCYLHVKLMPGTLENGGVYRTEWTSLPDYQAEREGIVRMRINEGSWTYEPIAGGTRTRAIYSAVSHPGGSLPDWLVNRSSLKFIPTLIKAIRDRLTSQQR